MKVINKHKIYKVENSKPLLIDLHMTSVNAGFPSPAEDHLDVSLDLNEFFLS